MPQPRERERAGRKRPDARDAAGMVDSRGHAFDERLVCSCGVSWWAHQAVPVPCTVGARERNCRGGESH